MTNYNLTSDNYYWTVLKVALRSLDEVVQRNSSSSQNKSSNYRIIDRAVTRVFIVSCRTRLTLVTTHRYQYEPLP